MIKNSKSSMDASGFPAAGLHGAFLGPHVAKQALQLLFRGAGYGSILGIKR
ncbi:MAG: hypothetical protein PVH43_00145 [Desulfobacterales bacterium]